MLCVSDFQRIAISNNSIHTQSEEVIPVFRKGEFSVNLQIIIVKQNPEILSGYTEGSKLVNFKGPAYLEGEIVDGTPYGWVQGLSLPTRETVEETIQMLYEEMQVV